VCSSQATWNTNGLLSLNPVVYGRKRPYAIKVANKHDISFFQECHGTDAEHRHFEDLLGDDFVSFFSFDPLFPSRGGLLTAVKIEFVRRICADRGDGSNFKEIIHGATPVVAIPGRLHHVDLCWVGWKLRLINFHRPPDQSSGACIQFIDDIADLVVDPSLGLTILAGDLNLALQEGDRVSLMSPTTLFPQTSGAKHFNDKLGFLLEHFQSGFTRADPLTKEHPTASKIDVIFSTHSRAQMAMHRHCVATWGSPLKEDYCRSDHVVVSSCISVSCTNPLPRIPKWVEKDPLFPEFIKELQDGWVVSGIQFLCLEEAKATVFEAADNLKAYRRKTPAHTTRDTFILDWLR